MGNIISIIIPIYNVEKYLPKCLNSVINQTFADIEIICVNDCSPDNSSKILEEYKNADSRIRVITHKKNEGLSAARNTGIRYATGEYIFFLDSDDWIDNDYIEKIVKAIKTSKADIIINRSVITEKDEITSRYIHPHAEVYQNNTFINFKNAIEDLIWNAWTKTLKKSFVDKNNLNFPKGFINEDLYFHYTSLIYTNKIYLISESNYHYTSRDSSISTNEKQKDIQTIKIFELIFDFYKKNNFIDKKIKLFYVMPFFTINSKEKFCIFKTFFEKIKNTIFKYKYIYNDIDIFFCKAILTSKDFLEYSEKYPANVALAYIKNERQKITPSKFNRRDQNNPLEKRKKQLLKERIKK